MERKSLAVHCPRAGIVASPRFRAGGLRRRGRAHPAAAPAPGRRPPVGPPVPGGPTLGDVST